LGQAEVDASFKDILQNFLNHLHHQIGVGLQKSQKKGKGVLAQITRNNFFYVS
jgi:hypothetical protein